jgi:hypothetical protein
MKEVNSPLENEMTWEVQLIEAVPRTRLLKESMVVRVANSAK